MGLGFVRELPRDAMHLAFNTDPAGYGASRGHVHATQSPYWISNMLRFLTRMCSGVSVVRGAYKRRHSYRLLSDVIFGRCHRR